MCITKIPDNHKGNVVPHISALVAFVTMSSVALYHLVSLIKFLSHNGVSLRGVS